MNTIVAEKRPLGALGRMGAVAGLHVAALYLIAASLGVVPSLIPKEPPVITLQPQPKQTVENPPPDIPQPQPQIPPLTMPPPVVPHDAFPTADAPTAVISDDPPEVPPVVPPAHQAVVVGVRQDARHPLTQPAYPAIDQRQGNEGSVELEVYVLPSGRVGDVRVLKSAGSATLDQSAIEEAKRKWRLLPATRDGEAYAQWYRLRVVFDLKER